MNAFDNITLVCYDDCVEDADMDEFSKDNLSDEPPHGPQTFTYKKNPMHVGLLGIHISKLRSEIKVKLNAKILHNKYLEGINRNTILDVISNLNGYGVIKINPEIVIDGAFFIYGDLSKNIKLKRPLIQYTRNLRIFGAREGFYMHNEFKTGLYISTNYKSNKHNVRVYPKFEEIGRDIVTNRIFRKYFNPKNCEYDLKIECRVASLDIARQYFDLPKSGDIPLTRILNSDVPALYNYMQDLLDYDKKMNSFPKSTTKYASFNEYKNEKFWMNELEECHNDIPTIRRKVESMVKGNIYSYMKEAKAVLLKKIAKELDHDTTNIEEIVEKLKE